MMIMMIIIVGEGQITIGRFHQTAVRGRPVKILEDVGRWTRSLRWRLSVQEGPEAYHVDVPAALERPPGWKKAVLVALQLDRFALVRGF